MDEARLQAWTEDVLCASLRASERLGGRNSLVERLTMANGRQVVRKCYPRPTAADGDERDRLGTEWAALNFLTEALPPAECRIPRPIAASRALQVGLYQYLAGDALTRIAGAAEVDQAVTFLAGLDRLGRHPAAAGLPRASEAFFHPREVTANLRRRLEVLLALAPDDPAATLTRTRLAPALERFAARTGDLGELPPRARVLSPSDFGFHNAVSSAGGLVFFLDFEYFGWDDPAKTISDFLLHPGMALSAGLRARFVRGLTEALEKKTGTAWLARRWAALFPLFGLAWCCILLNPFLPVGQARRRFAALGRDDGLLARRLDQAAALLARLDAWTAEADGGRDSLELFQAIFVDRQDASSGRDAHA